MSTLDDQEEPNSSLSTNNSFASDNSFSSSSNTTENTEPSVIIGTGTGTGGRSSTGSSASPRQSVSSSSTNQHHHLHNQNLSYKSQEEVQSSADNSLSPSVQQMFSNFGITRPQLPTAIVAPTEIMSTRSISNAHAGGASSSIGDGDGFNNDNNPPPYSGSPSIGGGDNSDSINNRTLQQQVEEDSKRYCWVCFATDEDDLTAAWVKPCRCRGTTKWVHQACIQRWIDEKQKGNATTKVSCPQCNTEYYIFYPKQGSLVIIMDSVDTLVSRVCPFVAAGIVVGSIYWTAVTYGAVTVMQIAGHKEGLSVMEQADPLVLLVGLPTIPIMLILGKMVRWEDYVLRFIRSHSWKVPLLRHILPTPNPPASLQPSVSQDLPPLSDPVSATRILCGALLLPTVASLLGKALFENVTSNFKRALLGGMAFITIKGVLRIYHKQQQYVRQTQRKIIDFHEHGTTTRPTTSNNTSVIATNTNEQELNARNQQSTVLIQSNEINSDDSQTS